MYEWKGHKPHPNGWAYSRETMERLDAEGRVWYPDSKAKRPQLKRYLDENDGQPLGNVWTDIPPINSRAAERLGYPTQKPLALLERIMRASSNPGDVVLDPFCGCGTAIDAAQRLGRKWIGIDVAEVAISVVQQRLASQYGNVDYVIGGEPGTIDEAEALARIDKHEFQRWACEKVGARPRTKKGADRGIDGEIIGTTDDRTGWRAIVSVKGGAVNVAQVRDLVGTVVREQADMGVFLALRRPTAAMKREAADAGFTETGQPRLQILTVADVFDGKRPELPAERRLAPVYPLPIRKLFPGRESATAEAEQAAAG